MEAEFTAELFEWRGPAPFYWLALPPEVADEVNAEAAATTYGWGAIPVRVRVGGSEWETSMLPRAGGYVLPVKKAVRLGEGLVEDQPVQVQLSVEPRGGREANGTGRAR
ncbi:MAG: hypothetical protein JWO22_2589 [Frankiales bacterium]|nr:hypothetical protein [Frankiales bacterium]